MTAYRDADGDVWEETSTGLYAYADYQARTLAALQAAYGPLTPVNDTQEEAQSMTREEALKAAVDVVNVLAPPQAGPFGVNVAARAEAAERLARFLMGEASAVED